MNDLPAETIQFARRMFNAAREGDGVLLQAVDAGLPPNMTNEDGAFHGLVARVELSDDAHLGQATPCSCWPRTIITLS